MIFKWPLNDYDACKLLEVQANQFNYPNNPDKLKKRSLNFSKKFDGEIGKVGWIVY